MNQVREIRPWVAMLAFVVHAIVLHVGVIGVLQWTNNSTGGRIAAAVVGIMLTVLTYVQEYYYARQLIFGTTTGLHTILLFILGFITTQWVQGVIFLIMASFGESYSVPVNVAEAFDAFYRYFFPMAVGVFMTAGNASLTPIGIPGHLWWVWTSWLGAIHLMFIFGFQFSRLAKQWIKSNDPQMNLAMEFGPVSGSIGIKKGRQGARRRQRAIPQSGHAIPMFSVGHN